MNNHKSTIDLILTNKPRSFQVTNVTETGVSDCHKLITTFMKSYISRLKPKNVHYRSYKNFNEEKFLIDVKEADFSFKTSNPDENYSVLTNVFSNIVNIHAPLKKKILRGNDAPFMNKELRKAIYTKSRLRNRYFKNPTKKNETSYKKQRNKCVSLRRIKLIILGSDFLSKLISKALNNCITSCTFPEVTTVVPIDKKIDDKYVISNYMPVSLLNGFSKIYEIHLKSHLVSSMNQHISNLVSAYSKNYSSQHVLIRLLEEWRKCLDNNYVVGEVLFICPTRPFNCKI